MKPPLNHMMLSNDALADDFERILGYRTSHAGLVLAAAGASTDARVTPEGDTRTTSDGDTRIKVEG